jgi:hypothetical protein
VVDPENRQRRYAPILFVMAAIVAVLGVLQFIHGIVKSFPMVNNVLVLVADLVLAGVMVALGLRIKNPPKPKAPPPPLRAPRPPR